MGHSTQPECSINHQVCSLRGNLFTTALFIIVFINLAYPNWLHGWSSAVPTSSVGGRVTAFATHEFLNEMAYEELKKHPAVKRGIVRFPSLDEIQEFSMIDVNQTGKGPDNPQMSDYSWHYSWHWLNPERGVPESKTPVVVAKFYGELRDVFLRGHLFGNSTMSHGTGAHQAAHAAH